MIIMEGKKRHFFKTDDYFAIGVWSGWILTWLYIAWKTTMDFLTVNGTVTVSEFIWINFIPIIFLIWNGSIVYRSRELLFKMKEKHYAMFLSGMAIIFVVMVFILLPLFISVADNILF